MTRVNFRLFLTWGLMVLLILGVGVLQGPTNAIMLVNIGLISGMMALGLNMQWGYAGLFNAGVMGSVVVGAVMVILVTHDPIPVPNLPPALTADSSADDEARAVAQMSYDDLLHAKDVFDRSLRKLLLSLAGFAVFVIGLAFTWRGLDGNVWRLWFIVPSFILGYILFRVFYDPSVAGVEAYQTANFGNIGGIGLESWFERSGIPLAGFWAILIAWLTGGLAAGGVAWLIGKITLGLRSDYFAIATLGIAEIVVSFAKNEQWLTRGVKNTNAGSIGSPIARPASSYMNQDPENGSILSRGMQDQPWVQKITSWIQGYDLAAFQETLPKSQYWDFRYLEPDFREAMIVSAKIAHLLSYTLIISLILGIIFFLAYRALNSPWGRMMRAIRDNETAAAAMGKNVVGRHLQVFVLGSVVIGIAGAVLVVVSGSGFTPNSYLAMRFTFLIWVMVIVGGSGNNSGVILGGMLIWFLWVQSDPIAAQFAKTLPNWMGVVKVWVQSSIPFFKFFFLGLILLLVLRFAPKGLIPEKGAERRR